MTPTPLPESLPTLNRNRHPPPPPSPSSAMTGEVRFPDIGPDPLASREAVGQSTDDSKERMMQGCSLQQKEVPDQTALVWRIDISRVCGELTWRAAAMPGIIKENEDLSSQLSQMKQRNEELRAWRHKIKGQFMRDFCHSTACSNLITNKPCDCGYRAMVDALLELPEVSHANLKAQYQAEALREAEITEALKSVLAERKRQTQKWGVQTHDDGTWLQILSEEVGEYSEACLHNKYGGPKAQFVRTEAVQVAAVALQIVEALDRRESSPHPYGSTVTQAESKTP